MRASAAADEAARRCRRAAVTRLPGCFATAAPREACRRATRRAEAVPRDSQTPSTMRRWARPCPAPRTSRASFAASWRPPVRTNGRYSRFHWTVCTPPVNPRFERFNVQKQLKLNFKNTNFENHFCTKESIVRSRDRLEKHSFGFLETPDLQPNETEGAVGPRCKRGVRGGEARQRRWAVRIMPQPSR
jgi:hypothetical protein